MDSKHTLVALISGGKDSIFSVYQSVKEGHKVIALAHISPREAVDELDSQMFQTVGYNIIHLYSECMGIPLYTSSTEGFSMCSDLEYTETVNDEVEDLYNLLHNIISNSKEKITAVCCGAIASNYQFNRVSNVANRLKLDVITPLWGWNDSELLNKMISLSLEAIIVKVSSAGLNDSHVGKIIDRSVLEQFSDLKKSYGMNICGEGGEYETMVLFCPDIFKKRIVITKSHKKILTNDPFSPVVILQIEECSTLQMP